MRYFLILSLWLIPFVGGSQSIEGVWETYDDESGELKSEVKIYIKDGKLYGKILKLYNLNIDPKDAKCELCTDYRKDQPVIGMLVMSGLNKSGSEWIGDAALLDPNNGKSYDAKVWLESNNKLAVRGYIGWFFRTQYWKKK